MGTYFIKTECILQYKFTTMSTLEKSALRNATESEIRLVQFLTQAMDFKAGFQNSTVTSFIRTPSDQARIMYENYARTGAKEQFDIYGTNGDRVIQSFLENRNLPPKEIISRAATLVEEMAQNGQYVSNHLSTRQRDNELLVFDIGLGSVENLDKLKAQAIAAGATKVLIENRALHIEIPKSKAQQYINKFMQEMSPIRLNMNNNQINQSGNGTSAKDQATNGQTNLETNRISQRAFRI
jgi:hypothetical protein